MRPAGSLALLAVLRGCGGPAAEPADGGGDADADALAECRLIEEGDNADFPVGNTSRNFTLVVPNDYSDAKAWPLVFVWHGLGDDDAHMLEASGLGRLAERQGFFAVAPESRHLEYEWDFLDGTPDDDPDVVVFDRLLQCMESLYRIDPDRVYSMGSSAGGLMTAYLGMYRAEVLAANAVDSGGLLVPWVQSDARPPWAVIWGGTSDVYLGLDFNASSLALIDKLTETGHEVLACNHDLGHTWPPRTAEYIWQFFLDHPRGAIRPYAGVLPATFPGYCTLTD
jgi:poly(3-hydroxybutyrate) depolymerase